jgi:hypothetical protein
MLDMRCKHFSLTNPARSDAADLPALLERLAKTMRVEKIAGDAVRNVVFGCLPWPQMSSTGALCSLQLT